MARLWGALASGLIFGFGLALSGMTHPSKVLDFLDVAGAWDPSLAFVLGGAVGTAAIAFRFVLRRSAPVFDAAFYLPTIRAIDGPLVVGAAVFGIGWGISGYCPGPAIASLAAPNWETWVFLPAVLAGIVLHRVATFSPEDTARHRSTGTESSA